jgi:hypothetical protein
MTMLIYKGSRAAGAFAKHMLKEATKKERALGFIEYKRAFEEAGQLSAEEDLERREKEKEEAT